MRLETEIETSMIACPHCGGEIEATANVCRHCKLSANLASSTSDVATALATSSNTPGLRPAVITDLRAFVLRRGLLRPEQFDAEHAKSNGTDAAVLLGHFAAAGYITPLQVEGLRDAFQQDQQARGARLLQAATTRGLLPPAKVQEAVGGFQQVAFTTTFPEYLVANGYLTRAQVEQLDSGGIARKMVRFLKDPAHKKPLIAGPGAMVAAVAIFWLGFIVPEHDPRSRPSRWPFALLVAPIVAVIAVQWKTANVKRKAAWGVSTFGVGVVALFLPIVIDEARRPPYIATVRPECTMNGRGFGTCVFTNETSAMSHSCGRIVVTCQNSEPLRSLEFCSGDVPPNQVSRHSFEVADVDRAVDRALPYGGDWRSVCSFSWEAD